MVCLCYNITATAYPVWKGSDKNLRTLRVFSTQGAGNTKKVVNVVNKNALSVSFTFLKLITTTS